MGWRIPVARPDIGAAEQAAVAAVMASGWITQGPKVRELEAGFARLCGVPHAVATNTGTAALHVALLALGVGAGDEVITTPLSCIASANPIFNCNLFGNQHFTCFVSRRHINFSSNTSNLVHG